MTYNNPGTHGMPDKAESAYPLYYAALGHSYVQNCLVAASLLMHSPILPQLLDRSPHSTYAYIHDAAWELASFLSAIDIEYSVISRPIFLSNERTEDASVTRSLRSLPVYSRPMIYRTVMANYKTVIMFYHPGQSTETARMPHDSRYAEHNE